jgi:hypothetical protein
LKSPENGFSVFRASSAWLKNTGAAVLFRGFNENMHGKTVKMLFLAFEAPPTNCASNRIRQAGRFVLLSLRKNKKAKPSSRPFLDHLIFVSFWM